MVDFAPFGFGQPFFELFGSFVGIFAFDPIKPVAYAMDMSIDRNALNPAKSFL